MRGLRRVTTPRIAHDDAEPTHRHAKRSYRGILQRSRCARRLGTCLAGGETMTRAERTTGPMVPNFEDGRQSLRHRVIPPKISMNWRMGDSSKPSTRRTTGGGHPGMLPARLQYGGEHVCGNLCARGPRASWNTEERRKLIFLATYWLP